MIAQDIVNRLLKGIGANLYTQVVVAIVQLAGVPILLHAWGTEVYGEWLILVAIPSYLSMTDLGFSISAANDMTAQVGKGNRREALAVFQSLIGLIIATSLIALALVVPLILVLPIESWLHLRSLSPTAIKWVLLLLSVDILARLFEGINHAGFRANGEYALHVVLANTVSLIQHSTVWIVALAGFGPVPASIAYIGVRVFVVPATAALLVRRHRWLVFGLHYARWSELRRLFAPALGNIAIPFAQALNIQGMVLMVGATLGPIAVVTFSTLRTLSRLTAQLVASISHAAEVEFAAMDLDTKQGQLSALYNQTMRLSLWVSAGAMCGVAIFGPFFLKIWTHGQVAMNYLLFGWLLAAVLSQTIWYGGLAMLRARNLHMRSAAAQVVAAGGSLLVAGVLLRAWGDPAAAGFALFIFDIALMVDTMRTVERFLGLSISATLRQALDPRPLRALVKRAGDF